jgi:hypothetical protein
VTTNDPFSMGNNNNNKKKKKKKTDWTFYCTSLFKIGVFLRISFRVLKLHTPKLGLSSW